MAVRKKVDIEEVQKKFFAQVQEEYDRFRYGQMKAGIDNVFKNSLKITFYKEVYRYLMDDVLHDDEYIEFLGEPIIEKLWDVFVVTELPFSSVITQRRRASYFLCVWVTSNV